MGDAAKGKPKVLVLGLDGATLDLIVPWAEQGRLPTLGRIMNEGVWRELAVEFPPGTVPNWPSFMTGKNPGKHGLVWWLKRDALTSKISTVDSSMLKQHTLWDILGDHGRQVVVINVPVTYPPRQVNGVMITGLLTPPSADVCSHPASLMAEIEAKVGEYLVYPRQVGHKGNEKAFLAELHRTIKARVAATRYLLQTREWDFAMVVFGCTDLVQHAMWKHMDPHHPAHDAEEGEKWGEAIRRVYEKVDDGLASILQLVNDDETTVIVMSDHGSGPVYSMFLTNTWLLQLGLLRLKRDLVSRGKTWLFRRGFNIDSVYPLAVKAGLGKLKRKVNPTRQEGGLLRKIFLSFDDVDWTRTRAYACGGTGQIYVNLRGRDPQGVVGRGAEYEALRDLIISKLLEITVPDTGERYVERAVRGEDLYWGEEVAGLPDVVFIPQDMKYSGPGLEFYSDLPFVRPRAVSGGHRSNAAVFMMQGRGVQGGRDIGSVHIRDLAPTILYLLDAPVPDDMDGRVLTQALEDDMIERQPIRFGRSDAGPAETRPGRLSAGEEAEIQERLRGLGYM